MAVRATRNQNIVYSGDVSANLDFPAATNTVSPGSVTIQDLVAGANTITVPVATGVTVTSVTIVPPAGNAETIILKGIEADTGIGIHPTDPTTIALASDTATFVLDAGDAISGVRFAWT